MDALPTQTDHVAASGPPSIPSLNLLDEMLFERVGVRLVDLDESATPQTQREVSALIDSLREKPALPTSDTQKDELLAHGLDPENYPDRSSAGKVLYVARRRAAAEEYAEARTTAAAKLERIFEQAGMTNSQGAAA